MPFSLKFDLRNADLGTLCQNCVHSNIRKLENNDVEIECRMFRTRLQQRVAECSAYARINDLGAAHKMSKDAWFLRKFRDKKTGGLVLQFIPPGHRAHPAYEGGEEDEVGF